MQGSQLEEALKQDEADRVANGTGQPGPAIEESPMGAVVGHADPVEIGFGELMARLDQKNAMLSKSVSMGLVDVARLFVSFVTQKGDKAPDPVYAEKCLVVVDHALRLADAAGRLGDKDAARANLSADKDL